LEPPHWAPVQERYDVRQRERQRLPALLQAPQLPQLPQLDQPP
jgi:hypothetical protein